MTTHVGKEGSVSVDANPLGELNGWELTETATPVEDSALSDEWKTFKSGADIEKEWSASVTVMWDPDDTTGQVILVVGFEATFVFQGEGTASGARIATGEGIIAERTQAVEKGAVTEREFTVTGNGALVWSDVP